MSTMFKQRMVGAIFILSLGVILIPVILEPPQTPMLARISDKPQAPDLPETHQLNEINYVFNDMEETHVAAAETVVIPKESPAPAVASSKPLEKAAQATTAALESASAPVAKSRGDWTVQLGAFSSQDNAKQLLSRLEGEGFASYLHQDPSSKLTRVYVAPGVERDDAQLLLTELNKEMGLKGIIVRYRGE